MRYVVVYALVQRVGEVASFPMPMVSAAIL